MIDVGYVTGCKEMAQPLVVGVDTVYVHTDIVEIEEVDEDGNLVGLYGYNEVQYGIDEYIKKIAEEKQILENQLVDTQLALCEIYESMAVM